MSRKNRKQHRNSKSNSSRPTKDQKPTTSSAPAKTKFPMNTMDIFRAANMAAKNVINEEARRVSTVDGFQNFISRVGLDTNNPLSNSFYDFNLLTKNRTALEAMYRGSWLAGVIVDAVADDMTREKIDITTSDRKSDLRVLFQNMTRLQIWDSLNDVIKWGRLYGGCLGVMQIEGQDLKTPLDIKTIAKDQFQGIIVYDRWQLNPVMTPLIESGPNLGLPLYYQIVNDPSSYDPNAQPSDGSVNVHYSRCIRITGIKLPYFQAITEQMWGESILERLYDRLVAFDNASMSSGQLIDRANLRTVGIQGLRELIAAGGEAQAGLEAQFEMMRLAQTNEGLTLIDKEDTFASTAYSFAGLSDMMLQKLQELSGASGIPLIRLLGQGAAGLGANDETALRMYYDSINAQQEAKLREPMDVLLRVLWQSTFGKPVPEDFEFTFKSLWQLTQKEKSEVAKTTTETIIGAYEAGLTTQKTSLMELRDNSSETEVFSNITDDDIESASEEPPPTPEENMAAQTELAKESEPKENKKPAKDGFTWRKFIKWDRSNGNVTLK